MQALVAGQIELIIDSPTIAMPQVRAGTIKGYAVAAKSRLETAPDIPTVDEAGLPGFYVSSWSGLWAPRGTPKDIIAKLNTSVMSGLTDATVRSRFADIGMEVFPREQQTPEALRAHQKAEIEKWWPIIKEAGIKTE
jgi:tripartite-type tricarboxylate transporter receptor subunit TctC